MRDGAAAGSASREAAVCYQERTERRTNQSRRGTHSTQAGGSGGLDGLHLQMSTHNHTDTPTHA